MRGQLAFLFTSLAIGPLAVVGITIGQRNFTSREQQSMALQRQVTIRVRSEVEAFILERENELVLLNQVYGLGNLAPEEQRIILSNMLLSQHFYQELFILNSEGQEQVRLSRSEVILNTELNSRADDDEFLIPITQGIIHYSPVRFDETIREPLLTVSIPQFDQRSGDTVAILGADIRFRPVWDLLAGIDLPGEGDAYIVDQTGRVVAHRNPSIILSETTIELPKADGRGDGLFGTDVFIARELLQLGDQEFTVVAEQPVSVARANAYNTLRVTLVVTFATLVVIGILVMLATRTVVRPIENLALSTRIISRGDFSVQVPVPSRGQGEVGELAKAFNEMASQLQQTLEGLEQEIIEREKSEKAREVAEAANQAKDRLLAIVSHELRTPLNAILGYTEILQSGIHGSFSARQEQTLDRIHLNVSNLESLITDLLVQAQVESGQLELEITSFATMDLIDYLNSTLSLQARNKGLELNSHIAEDVPSVIVGDLERLQNILTNLVVNAIKFTQEGSVNVRIFLPDVGHWALQVSDTGPGISEKDRSHIFEPFVQVDDVVTRENDGIGLGLSIVMNLVMLMDGEIKLESEVGQGSTFTVLLPLILA